MKKVIVFSVCFLATVLVFAESGLCIEDCFNYQWMRQDLAKTHGWDVIKEYDAKGKDNFILQNRWSTIDLNLTPDEERERFGTTGLEVFKKQYLVRHYDGSSMRMFVYVSVEHKAGERKLLGWRAELNPAMPVEYLDPKFPEEKKEDEDWFMLMHWSDPSDIRGSGVLIHSYNDKSRDQDTWVWFPSLRKSRRLTPSAGDDSVAGTDLTFADGFLLTISDERYQIIGETSFTGFLPVDYYEGLQILDKYGPNTKEYVEFYKRTIAQPRDCWVVRAKSVKGGYGDWYDTRIIIIDKEWNCDYSFEIYDRKGKMMRSHVWFYRRTSDFHGKPHMAWVNLLEILNFEDLGFTYYAAPQTMFGCHVPEAWGTLRELKRSIPTVTIPYMVVLPPEKLAPLEELYPPEIIEARKKFFPKRLTSFPDPTSPIGLNKW